MDRRVLLFTVLVSLLMTVFFALTPALRASRADVKDALRHGGSRGTIDSGSPAMRNGLVVAQVALAYMLAINAGLLLRSFVSLTEVPLGFRTEGIPRADPMVALRAE